MSLDIDQTNAGYLCGRLLACLEALEAAAIPEPQRNVFYNLLPQLSVSPGIAITATISRSPAWLTKLIHHDPAAADLHKARIGDLLDRIPSPHVPADEDTRAWACLGYHHQVSADVAAGLRPDQDHPITTDEVATLLGCQGNSATRSAASWLARQGIKPIGRQPGRSGQNMWSHSAVMSAKRAAPGRGARTDLTRDK